MKEHCEFSVQGMDLECPLCGELVKSGNLHFCDKDGGVSSRKTVPIKSLAQARGLASAAGPQEGLGSTGVTKESER